MKIRAVGPFGLGTALCFVAPALFAQDADCTAPAAWFPQSQTPPPNNDGPFDSNCAFHQWSWNAFLYLTQSTGESQLRFETLIPASAVVDGTLPPVPTGDELGVTLIPRTGKSDMSATFDEVAQAGSQGLLVDQAGRAVYYAMLVNDVYYDFVVTDNQLNVPANLLAADPTMNYPVGAVTLKAAWKIVGDGEDVSAFHTTPATVRLLTTDASGNVVVSPDQTADVTVALVGLHVVGIVEGHPEAIWATFEHRQNAPDFGESQAVDEAVSSRDFTFYAAGTAAGDCNQGNVGALQLTDEAAQTLAPVTQVCRQYPFGGGSAANVGNIASLNASVHAQLEPDSVWRNYMETGAIWFIDENALEPNMAMRGPILTGSVSLSNATIETFTQKVVSEEQCFSCHRTDMVFPPEAPDQPLPGKNLNISHILLNAYVQNLTE